MADKTTHEMRMTWPILIWRFYDAPEWMRHKSPHGGDEDWLVYIPACQDPEDYFPWLQIGALAPCDVSRHPLDDGSCIYIGAHA